MGKIHIKIGDTVKVLSGTSKGSEGKVLTIDRAKNRAVVEGVNMIKKHMKPSAANPQGGIEEMEGTIHISNRMVVSGGVASRIGRKKDGDQSVRYLKKNGEIVK